MYGFNLIFSWENRQEYVDVIRGLRFQELLCEDRVRVVYCGIVFIIFFQFMALMFLLDLEIRISGLFVVDFDFFKVYVFVYKVFQIMEFKVEINKKKGILEFFIVEVLIEYYYFLEMNFIFVDL